MESPLGFVQLNKFLVRIAEVVCIVARGGRSSLRLEIGLDEDMTMEHGLYIHASRICLRYRLKSWR